MDGTARAVGQVGQVHVLVLGCLLRSFPVVGRFLTDGSVKALRLTGEKVSRAVAAGSVRQHPRKPGPDSHLLCSCWRGECNDSPYELLTEAMASNNGTMEEL